MAEESLPKIHIKYIRTENCPVLPVSGAVGGLTPTGDVSMMLFQETLDEPTVMIRDQLTKKEVPAEMPKNVSSTRLIQAIAVIRADVAKTIGEWLIKNAEDAERQLKKHD
jgi:hypothetical protein